MKKLFLGMALLASAMVGGIGCSGSSSSDGGSTTPSLTISGTVASVGMMSVNPANPASSSNSALAVSLSDLKVYATCFSTPPAIGEADVQSDGKFTVNLSCAAGSAVSALFLTKTDEAQVGMIYFVDSSKKDMSGNSKESTTVTLTGNTDFGSITIGSDGKVSIPVSQISTITTTPVSSATAFDFTGVWAIAAYDGTLPKGYANANSSCNMQTGQGCDQPGPPVGMPLTVIRYAGKSFTPATDGSCNVTDSTGSGTCAGTAGTDDVYGIGIWGGDATTDNMSGIKACGYKTGFTVGEARKHANIDLDGVTPSVGGQTLTFSRVTFAAASGFGGDTCTGNDNGSYGCNQPWMKTGSTANWDVQKCVSVTKTGSNSVSYNLYACEVNNGVDGARWSAFLATGGGGCVDSTGKGIRVENWTNSPTSCDSTAHPVAGLQQTTCTYTNQIPYSGASAMNYTCTHVGGLFTASNLNTAETGTYNYNHTHYTKIAQSGSNCKDIPSTNELDRLKCYAQNYHGGGGDMFSCSQRYMMDWNATSAANFVKAENRAEPDAMFITDIATYSPDGSTVFVNSEKSQEAQVWGATGGSQICPFNRVTKIAMKKISDTKLLWDLTEVGVLQTTDAACRAAAADVNSTTGECNQGPSQWLCEELRGRKYLFYTNKQ